MTAEDLAPRPFDVDVEEVLAGPSPDIATNVHLNVTMGGIPQPPSALAIGFVWTGLRINPIPLVREEAKEQTVELYVPEMKAKPWPESQRDIAIAKFKEAKSPYLEVVGTAQILDVPNEMAMILVPMVVPPSGHYLCYGRLKRARDIPIAHKTKDKLTNYPWDNFSFWAHAETLDPSKPDAVDRLQRRAVKLYSRGIDTYMYDDMTGWALKKRAIGKKGSS